MQNVTMSTGRLPPILTRILPERLLETLSTFPIQKVEELRLSAGRCTYITIEFQSISTGVILTKNEIASILSKMCQGSLYRYEESIKEGYLTMEGGIRVGVCGRAATKGGQVLGVSDISGLIVRLPHEVPIPTGELAERVIKYGSMLIYAPPGIGKTTLLREAAKAFAASPGARRTVLVDSREELQFGLLDPDLNLTVLSGYPREKGIEIAVRSLGAEIILCDEIGSQKDAEAILSTSNCGIPILATAHAKSLYELLSRPGIATLHRSRVFATYTAISRHEAQGFSYIFTDWKEALDGSGIK